MFWFKVSLMGLPFTAGIEQGIIGNAPAGSEIVYAHRLADGIGAILKVMDRQLLAGYETCSCAYIYFIF